jgi:hypothetical protein
MDPHGIIGCLALFLGGLSMLQLDNLTYRKIGMAAIWLASGLATYFLTRSPLVAGLVLLAWLFFPLWEMFFVLRKLQVPRHRELIDARAPHDEFDELPELTRELVRLDFEQIDECKLNPSPHEQYYRIFVSKDGLSQATLGYVAQGAIGFHFIAFTSNDQSGHRWVTWDYPLTYGLVMPPKTAVYRALQCETVEDLRAAHADFLEVNGVASGDLVAVEPTREAVRSRLEETLNQQVEYNILKGILTPTTRTEPDSFRYSWRGTFYVARQVLRDLLF